MYNKLIQRYLDVLNIKKQKPDLEFLKKLVNAQLENIPYENVSKLLRLGEGKTSIPSFEEFLDDLESCQYGGTCWVQNGYFVELLKALGFEADLIAAGSAEDPQSHVAIVVRSDERNFVVDLGMFSIFAGPFELKVGNSQQLQVGKTTYFFEPLSDNSFLMRTFRNGEPGRVRQGKNDPVSLDFFSEAIKKSFAKDTAMMKALAIHRVLNSQPAYSWGNVAYIGDVRFEFSTFQDFESAICQKLKLPKYNLKRAYEVLISHGGEKLF